MQQNKSYTIIQSIRHHSSDIFLGISPSIGKTDETMANQNNWMLWIDLLNGAECDNIPKGDTECV